MTVLTVQPAARVLLIDGDDDMAALDAVFGRGSRETSALPSTLAEFFRPQDWVELHAARTIDWERVGERVDAVWVTEVGVGAGGAGAPRADWDVATVWFPHGDSFDTVNEVALDQIPARRRSVGFAPLQVENRQPRPGLPPASPGPTSQQQRGRLR